jgi:RHS repeat-associated protein
MGFYATDERAEVLESHQENLIPPSKNRVWNFFTTSETCTGFFESQPVEPHQEKWPTPTTTVSGVHYYGYRYYVPEIGRWLGRDPIKEKAARIFLKPTIRLGRNTSKNLFSFCFNQAVNFHDSLGLQERCQSRPEEGCSEGATRELLSNCYMAGGVYTGEALYVGFGDVTKEMPYLCCYCERKNYDLICDVTRQKCAKVTMFCFDGKCDRVTRTYQTTSWVDDGFTPHENVRSVAAGYEKQWCHTASINDLYPPITGRAEWEFKQKAQCVETCRGLAGSDGE